MRHGIQVSRSLVNTNLFVAIKVTYWFTGFGYVYTAITKYLEVGYVTNWVYNVFIVAKITAKIIGEILAYPVMPAQGNLYW